MHVQRWDVKLQLLPPPTFAASIIITQALALAACMLQ